MKIRQIIVLGLIFLCIQTATATLRLATETGPIYIRADGTVEPTGAPIQRSGDVYTLTDNVTSQVDGIVIEKSGITFDGSGYTVQGGASGNGFYLHGISNVTIGNVRTEGFNYGIYLESTSRNVISRNDIKGSTYDGIGLYDAANNSVSSNSITENDWSGIGLYFSTGNNISANYIANNYYGMNCFSSQENWIFHNNFVANTNQTSSDDLQNAWDNGREGNYWSNYNGTDANGDYIGDTPYVIDQNNIDRYPLMYIYWSPCDINHDLKVNMKDVAAAARAFGTSQGDALWNPHADITGLVPLVPDGKVDMRDISLIARNFGKKYA